MKSLLIFETTEELNRKFPQGLPSSYIGYNKETQQIIFKTNNISGEMREYITNITSAVDVASGQETLSFMKAENVVVELVEVADNKY